MFPLRPHAFRGAFLSVLLFVTLGSFARAQSQVATPDPAQKVRAGGGYQALLARARRSGAQRVIVKLAVSTEADAALPPAVALSQRSRIADAQRAMMERVDAVRGVSAYHFEFIPFSAMSVDAAQLQALVESPLVELVEEDVIERATLDLSVPRIRAPQVWSRGFGGVNVAVAVLDTGVDKNHGFIGASSVISEACYSSTNASSQSVCPGGVTDSTAAGSAMPYAGACPTGDCDHGTHVAGIVAGGTGTGLSGVAPSASLIPIQVFSRFDSEAYCGVGNAPCVLTWTSDQIKGLERVYALRNTYNIAAVNMSLGGGRYFDQASCDSANATRKAAIDNLRSANIATVISSGNSAYPDSLGAPGCISTAVSVGATTDSDTVANYSNTAPFLNLLAPGSSIYSSLPGGAYASWSGTSMAAPHVAGAWALLRQAAPEATVTQVLTALSSTGVLVIDPTSAELEGATSIAKPRINVEAALEVLVSSLPGKPTLISPSGIVATTTPTFVWNAVATATWYGLQVQDSLGLGPLTWYSAAALGCGAGTGTCSSPAPSPVASGTAQWRVLPWNSSGYGPYSDWLAFTVSTVPGAATPVSPAGTIATSTPTYTWQPASGATWYGLQVQDVNGVGGLQWYSAAAIGAACATGTGTCSVSPGATVAAGGAQWRVLSWNSSGYGPYSAWKTFTVSPPPPGAATPQSTTGPTGSLTPTYTWQAAAGATYYALQIEDKNGVGALQWVSAASLGAGCGAGTGLCAMTPLSGPANTQLAAAPNRWRVLGWNAAGYSPYSAWRTFTVPLGTPLPATPQSTTGPTGSLTPTYTWQAAAGATYYALQIEDKNGVGALQWVSAASLGAGCGAGTGLCAMTPVSGPASTPLTGAVNRWRVLAWNATGYSPYGVWQPFTLPVGTPLPATPQSTTGSTGSLTPTYTWQAAASATYYALQIEDKNGVGALQWVTAASLGAGCGAGTGLCAMTPASGPASTQLAAAPNRWRVLGWNATGYSPYSAWQAFTVPVGTPLPGTPQTTGPTGSLTPTYTWQAAAGATYYALQIEDDTGVGALQWVSAASLGTGCGAGTGLCAMTPASGPAGTQQAASPNRWRVLGWNATGYSPYSAWQPFTVPVGTPLAATLMSPTGATGTPTPTYAWAATAGATWYALQVQDTGGTGPLQWYSAAALGCPAGTGSCTVSPGATVASGAAAWRVLTWNLTGYGPWSAWTVFSVP